MITKTCPRLWEVEAAHVGQLDRALRAAQREHQKTCGECGRMACSLLELKDRLLALEPPVDEITLRRLRQLTLQRAALSRPARPRGVRVRAVALALAAVAVALALVASSTQHARGSLVEVSSEVEPSSWSRHHSPRIERVSLREGVFSLNVRRGADDPRVVVEIPEGEIEDVGTLFSVTVRDGHTTRIAVRRGAVVLRRSGLPPLRLLAGSVWQPVPKPLESARARVEPELAPPPAPPPTAAAPRAPPAHHTKPLPHPVSAAPRLQPAPPSAAPPALADEDACYLEFVHLLRQRRTEAARRIGAEYLERYPRGFRRPDVERALHEPRE